MVKHYQAEETGIDLAFGICLGPHHFVKPSFDLHTHAFMELVIVLGGSGLHVTDYGNYRIQAGDVFAIHGDTAHGFAESTGMDIMNFMFTASYLEETSKWLRQSPGYHALFVLEPIYRHRQEARNRLRLSAIDLKAVTRMIQHMVIEYTERKPAYRAQVTAMWQQLLTHLCRSFSGEHIASLPFLPLADTLAYMEAHFTEEMSLDDLAAQAHMSKNHFIRLFKQHYNETPNRYLNQLRLDYAKELLRSTDRSMTDIALHCGFCDGNYFSRSFRQAEGQSPRSYRQAIMQRET